MSDFKQIKGKARVTFSRYTSPHGEGGWGLTITDEASRTIVADLEITHDQFSHMFGAVTPDVEATFYVSDRIGKKMEVTKISVPCEGYPSGAAWTSLVAKAEQIAAAMGGILDTDPCFNHHRYADDEYSFTVRKWV
jgi:hypothetical protein